ncbi:hypothetical protein ATEIFO6365_0007001000 [Aspergillus terreus]|uniref:Uncharacterized protein n=1 Tax=Aspergillus terreus TaxID=33178 RepID=A0A5M3Z3S8_ASPTE|nr:hypothetical protein ATETN484_0009001000 [Aspergillus terreus]GFF17461.1 hypothetical protein ATEIFO6365_0007001000 [Aspergillus terreus]
MQQPGFAGASGLHEIAPIIEAIRTLFQAPSFSIGVVYHGETIYTKGFGQADEESRRVPDHDTVYTIASCTKGFTGTAIGLLVDEGKLDFDAKVAHYIPSFFTRNNPAVSQQMTGDVIQICNHLPRESEFRSEWKYNNWMFALAGVLIQQTSQQTFGRLVQKEVFDALGRSRTACENPNIDDNYARPYLAFSDGSKQLVHLPDLSDGWAFDASGSVRSSVRDMLIWAKALMTAWRTSFIDQGDDYHRAGKEVAPPCPFSWLVACLKPQTSHTSLTPGSEMFDEKIPKHYGLPQQLARAMKAAQTPYFPLASDPKQAYAMGLFTFQLPTTEMDLVTNTDVITTSYRLGAESPLMKVVGHTGELGGFLSAYWTFPEEDSAVVVLCNSFQLNGDPTNIVAQLLTQALFDLQPKIDFLEIAKEIVLNSKRRWDTLVHEWNSHRVIGTTPGNLQAYQGTYINPGLALTVEISASNAPASGEQTLRLRINSDEEQTFNLHHYHHDTWSFLPASRDECIRQGYSVYLFSWEAFLIEFTGADTGQFRSLIWKLDLDSRVERQTFTLQHGWPSVPFV